MTQPTDDLAAQMVREMGLDSWFIQDEIERCEAIGRWYMEKAVATVSADAFYDGYHAGKIDASRQPEKGSTDER
jgi:hypothetical protein